MNNQQFSCDLSSSRARKARLSVLLDNKPVRIALKLIIASALLLLIFLVFISKRPGGYFLLIPAAYCALPLLWYQGELKELPAGTPVNSQPGSIDMILERKLLGRLKDPVTPKQLAQVSMKLPGGIFFINRYAVSRDFVTNLASAEPSDSQDIWQYAHQLTDQMNNEDQISAAAVTAALLFTIPDYNFYLSQLKLDGDDIVAGLRWYNHVAGVFKNVAVKQNSGGIGRDLSFGWSPRLDRYGNNITEGIMSGGLLRREIEGHEDILSQMIHVLSQSGRRNATLVGEVGVGKTTLVYALAQRIMTEAKKSSRELRYRQIIELNASTLLSHAKGRGDIEGLLIQLFNEAIHAKNIIIFLDEAHLFLKDGTGSVDLANILLPVLEGGALQIILSIDDQNWLGLSQSNPGLAQLMNRVVVQPLDKTDSLRVMEDQILLLEARNPVVFMHRSLTEAYSMADRFITDQAFPGKAIRLLEAAVGFPEDKHFITEKSIQQAVEKNFGVKVQVASSSEERDTLLNLEGRIHERMINQVRAVQVVSDALRRARAGVRNQNKPIGTFLFLGPTGVGKTELAKSLAAVYFGGEDRIVRVDLNEYSQESDVTRLLEVGAANSTSLTAQIAKQPFSVVLLDEIEKAHPNVLNVLLQLLDEGTLRDAQNKPISFKDAIVIATSNAGADRIREHIQAGEQLEQFEDQFITELIDSNIFRPEFLNRFDETVLFRPLTVEELKQVVDLIVLSINKTLATQKYSVSLTDEAKGFLAQEGYDPRLGARPLRRVTQRSIENIMAQKILSGTITPGSVIQLDVAELQEALSRR